MIRAARRDPVRWLALAGLAGFAATAFIMPPVTGTLLVLTGLGLVAAVAYARPAAAMAAWLLLVETTPEMWLSDMIGHHELIIAALKSAGLLIVALAALRNGARFDRFNPSYAFAAMFGAGLVHGFWPGLTMIASFRSLVGSAAPFAPGFLRLTPAMRRGIVRCTIIGPSVTMTYGAALAALGVRALYGTQQGAVRLIASSNPAFLGGFAMIAVFAGLVEFLRAGRLRESGWIAVNFVILLATGARAPLALAVCVTLATLLATPSPHLPASRRIALLAAGGVVLGAAIMAFSALHAIRVVDLIHLGEAGDLSNRNLIWPDFEAAIARSPLLGWGVGAGKVIVPLQSHLGRFLGTNAAHNEYLRIAAEGGVIGAVLLFALLCLWLRRGTAALPAGQRLVIRLVFLAFAVQSFTDNTLIATTSLAFFTWARAVFADADEGPPAA
ncbi:O-antigen ligase family protein [Acidiphilium sp. AL]|uniref:O-antigen ligase family protein n=1 Tax=Acidiphilium iwatense TaxID=768198 RepID=A0ABS9DQV4_9PROT|nr:MULTISPECIES: O-antigen ligase family protein [Acidiphilium]MCF3945121.1 O-antigen ligase family protein [Acidiphilium iwatense]MCU4160534.1 O-antigen ligase family protein [Acidiphilium sp. AL]